MEKNPFLGGTKGLLVEHTINTLSSKLLVTVKPSLLRQRLSDKLSEVQQARGVKMCWQWYLLEKKRHQPAKL